MLKRLTLFAAIAATAMTPALAQKRQPSPDERIERLEKQVNQVQRRVYGKQPVDTAGFTLDPAVTQSELTNVTTRLDSIERQMADLVRTSEENSNRLATMEAQLLQMRAAAERREREAPVVDEPVESTEPGDLRDGPPPRSGPKYENRDEPAERRRERIAVVAVVPEERESPRRPEDAMELAQGGPGASGDKPSHTQLSEREFQIFCKLAAGQSVS